MQLFEFSSAWLGRSVAAILFTALTATQLHAQVATASQAVTRVQTVEGITEYRLANGLKVLLAPDAADDRVTVNLTYLVGSRHEGYGETGMAHLLEHLIFKGTPATPDPKAEFRQRGFTFNGTTTADRTNYFATMVSNQASLNWYLGWQADAMVHSFIAKKDLDSEMSVVRSEFEIGENNPSQALLKRMARAAYQWHAYGKSTIGAKSDIENVDIASLQAFYKRYYRPDNAVLIVAGKFDVAQTLVAVEKSLGAVAKPEQPIARTYTQEPVQDGEHSVVVRRPSSSQLILSSYHAPAALHPDSIALAVLATALGDVPSGRLHKALVEAKLAQAAFAFANAQREAGSIVFGTTFGPDDDPAVRQKLLLDIVENVAREPITQEEFDRAKAKINKGLELAFANAAAVANGAMAMEVAGDWRAVFVGRERMKSVSLTDVNRVARAYLLPDNRTLGQLIPTKAPQRAPEIAMPDVAAYLNGFQLNEKGLESVAFDFSIPSLHDKVLFAPTAGGIKTAALEKPVRGDLVQLNIAFKFGHLEALRGQDGPASFVGPMLLRGTARMSRQEIQDALVKVGAALNLNFSETGGALSLTVKKDNFKPALELALHALKESNFPEKEFEEMRAAQIKGIEGQINDKSAQANSAWGRYGNPYPKGDTRYQHTLEEWLQELKSVTRDQAYDFYKRFYGAQNAQISLLGPVDAKEYRELLASALDGWKAAETWKRVEQPLVERKPARLVFDTPDKTNVNLRAYEAVPVSALGMEPDYFALELASRVFGGGPGSRLWVRLRETGGLSYSAGAGFSASAYERSGKVSLSAEVAPQNVGAAEAALREELARSLEGGFTAAEVEKFKREYLADRLRGRSGDGWAMGFMSGQMEFDFARDAREKNDALIAALSAAQVNATWKQYVRPEQLVWGIFGDQSKIK
jgi:zinc protease